MRFFSANGVLPVSGMLGILLLANFLACSSDSDGPTDSNGSTPKISVADVTVAEGNTALFAVSLDTMASQSVVFSYFTADSTATAPDDYTSRAGIDTIPAHEQQAVVMVSTTDDQQAEPSESFKLVVSSASGAVMADSVAVGTIFDDDQQAASFVADVQPILRASCALAGSCHGGTAPVHGLAIGSDADYDSVIIATGLNTGGLVVVPGDSTSTLYTKTTETPPFPIRMPANGPPFLNSEQQQKIRDWILGGALDN